MMRMAFALVETVWSTKGVLRGCWGSCEDFPDGMGEWTYSTHWRSRER